MMDHIIFLASTPAPEQDILSNPFPLVGAGSVGTLVLGAVVYGLKILIDHTIPSRSSKREDGKIAVEGLKTLVNILQEEKREDAERLRSKQERIDQLEGQTERDYNKIVELRNEVLDLRNRLAVKDQRIQLLVVALRNFGQEVVGLDTNTGEIKIDVPKK